MFFSERILRGHQLAGPKNSKSEFKTFKSGSDSRGVVWSFQSEYKACGLADFFEVNEALVDVNRDQSHPYLIAYINALSVARDAAFGGKFQ